MSGLKNVVKSGWHPSGKDGKKESWRGDFKGVQQIAGLVGKGKGGSSSASSGDHQSTPLSALRDPAAFGTPPRKGNSYGSSSAGLTTSAAEPELGLGAPIPQAQLQAQMEAEEAAARAAAEEASRPVPPPVPYRKDTTGLNTSNLPKPPLKRPGAGVSSDGGGSTMKPGKPSLPPRLPPRQISASSPTSPVSPPLTYPETTKQIDVHAGYLNQGALGRLGQAGVLVPGLNVGGKAPPTNPQAQKTTAPAGGSSSQMSGVTSRFSKMSPPSSQPTSPSQGTSFADKRAALRTASSFRKDPSSVSFSDAKRAASTANNFGERHGEQTARGLKAASGLNQKYGMADKLSGTTATVPSVVATEASPPLQAPVAKKRAPPPPPPKKRELGVQAETATTPPLIPLASKPRSNQ